MNDSLAIIIRAILDEQKVTKDINKQLATIQQKIDALKINISFDEKVLNVLKDFSASIQKVNDIIKHQNEVIRQNITYRKELDGTVTKIEQSFLRSGEVIEKTTQLLDFNTQAIEKNIDVRKKLSKVSELYKGEEATPSIRTEVYKDDKYHQEIIKKNAKTQEIITRITIDNIEKRKQAELKALEKQKQAELKARQETDEAILKTIRDRIRREQEMADAQERARQKYLAQEHLRIKKYGDLKLSGIDPKVFEGNFETVRNNLEKYLQTVYGVNAEIVKLKRNFTATGNEFWTFTTRVKTGKDTFRQYQGVIDRTTASLYEQGYVLRENLNRNLSFWKQFEIAIQRIPIWMAGMTMFYQTLRFFTNGIRYVNELNKALTEISMVTNKSQAEVAELGKEYQKLAVQMGVSTEQIAEASVTFYRQGLNQAEVMERVKYATMGAKVAAIDFAQAAEYLTSATNGMNVSAQRASDVFAYLGNVHCPLVA